MFRVPGRLSHRSNIRAWRALRYQSQQPGTQRRSGGAATIVVSTTAGLTLGLAGIIGYAAWSEENRKVIDDNIPGIQYVTDALLGVIPAKRPPPVPTLVMPPPPVVQMKAPPKPVDKEPSSPMTKKIDREKQKVAESAENVQLEAEAPPLTASPPPPPSPVAAHAAKDVKPRASPVLTDAVRAANTCVTAALQAAERAVEAVQRHSVDAVRSLDGAAVEDGVKAAVATAVTAAEEALQQAREGVASLSSTIANSRGGDRAQASLAAAEEALAELGPAVDKVKALISDSLKTTVNIESLCNSARKAREELPAALRSVLPAAPELLDKDAAEEQRLLILLGHSYDKRQELLQRLAEKTKALEDYRNRRGVEGEIGGVSEAGLQAELDKLRHQLMLQHRSDLARQQEELEAEVRGQLKRQAAAHADHLTDSLTKQQHDLTAAWQVKLFDEVNKEKDRHYREIANIKGRLLGLQTAVTARADADRAARSARQLWLACQALRNTLRLGRDGATTWDEQLQPLEPHLTAIAEAGELDPFISCVVSSVGGDSLAASRGVYTEEALRHRFARVDTVSRRVALVGENGGSLLRYLLSYLQAALLVQASPASADDTHLDVPVNIHELSTFDILDHARLCLLADDMAGAVRWLNQLTGESRRVTRDWREEARRTLEMRQAADALMAHAAATTATAL